nr:MAG TPA: hypothetical protein [Caudoviricetes sp.]
MKYYIGVFVVGVLSTVAGDILKDYLYRFLKKRLSWSPLARYIFNLIDKADARKDKVIARLQKKSLVGKIAAVIFDCLDDIIDIFCS